MTKRQSGGKDAQFKAYVGETELKKFRDICNDMGMKYSEVARRLIATFNEADAAGRRWMLGVERGATGEQLLSLTRQMLKGIDTLPPTESPPKTKLAETPYIRVDKKK